MQRHPLAEAYTPSGGSASALGSPSLLSSSVPKSNSTWSSNSWSDIASNGSFHCAGVIAWTVALGNGPALSAPLGYDTHRCGSDGGMRGRAHREHVAHKARVGRERGNIARGVRAALR